MGKVPQAHKIALTDIPKGADMVHFGVVLAHALENIAKGRWINEHMIDLPVASPLDQMEYGTNIVPVEDLPDPTVTTWDGYKNPNGGFGGTRNILAIQTAGQCVEGVVNVALDRIKHELLPKYPPTSTMWGPTTAPTAAAWPSTRMRSTSRSASCATSSTIPTLADG